MKKQFNANQYCTPSTTVILGTHRENKPTFMALAWWSRINFKPALFAIGVNKLKETNKAIAESGEFSISVPSTSMVEATDYVGIVSAKKTDKSALFELFYGELKSAPMIKDCPITLACKVQQVVDLPSNSNTIFIGELVEAWCDEDKLVDGKPDPVQVDPIILTMPDNTYWKLGEKVGDAWKIGKDFNK